MFQVYPDLSLASLKYRIDIPPSCKLKRSDLLDMQTFHCWLLIPSSIMPSLHFRALPYVTQSVNPTPTSSQSENCSQTEGIDRQTMEEELCHERMLVYKDPLQKSAHMYDVRPHEETIFKSRSDWALVLPLQDYNRFFIEPASTSSISPLAHRSINTPAMAVFGGNRNEGPFSGC